LIIRQQLRLLEAVSAEVSNACVSQLESVLELALSLELALGFKRVRLKITFEKMENGVEQAGRLEFVTPRGRNVCLTSRSFARTSCDRHRVTTYRILALS
jgi:hypothetical protein